MQCKGTRTLFWLITELLPFVLLLLLAIVCLEYNLKTTGWSFMKLNINTKLKERKCTAKTPELFLTNYRVIALCYFFLSTTLLENYWMDFHETLYNNKAQVEKVQYKWGQSCFKQLWWFLLILWEYFVFMSNHFYAKFRSLQHVLYFWKGEISNQVYINL